MIEDAGDWLHIASATFAGSSVAILVVRWLGQTVVGHWLAKALAKYSAEVETGEARKRLLSERLDRERSETLTGLMEKLAELTSLIVYPPHVHHTEQPEDKFLARFGEITTAVRAVIMVAVEGAHRFGNSEPLIRVCLEWSTEVSARCDEYFDALEFDNAHWNRSREDRTRHLIQIFESVWHKEIPTHKKVVSVCRQLYWTDDPWQELRSD